MTTKVPAELSSTPGIVDNSNATAITIDSSENVGIGSTSPDSHLHLESSVATSFRIRTTSSSSEPQMIMIDGAGDYFSMQKVDRGMTFKPQGAEEVRIDADGLKFNGDTAAANALDDYEEGTFTPTVTSGITSVGYAAQTGYYTKIGNLVLFNLRIATNSGNAQSSTFAVGNLPFNSAATQQPGGAAIRAYASSFSSSGSQAFIGPASNSISFYTLAGTAFAGTSITDHDGFDLRITGIYRA
jgi:hypothetical protein